MKINMEKLARVLYSKRVNLFMMYFSMFAFVLFIELIIETIINGKPIWYSITFLLFALLSVNSFRVSRKHYIKAK